jgi:hypothetical protein
MAYVVRYVTDDMPIGQIQDSATDSVQPMPFRIYGKLCGGTNAH